MLGTGIILGLALVPLWRLRRVEHYVSGPGAPASLE
jgi:hypothetical protein